jgi:hypothetical protein
MRFSASHANQPAGMIFGIIASGLEQQPLLWHIRSLGVTCSKASGFLAILTMPAVKIRRMVSVRDALPAMHPGINLAPQANQPIQHC